MVPLDSFLKGGDSMRKFAIIAVALLVVGLVGYPVAAETISGISDILANPTADQQVTVTGTVSSSQAGENEFVLSDATGAINVCAGPAWFQAIALAQGEKVTVTGEVGCGSPKNAASQGPSLDASTIVKEDGSTVVVRDGPGRPPWAGLRGQGKGCPPAGTAEPDTDDADDSASEAAGN